VLKTGWAIRSKGIRLHWRLHFQADRSFLQSGLRLVESFRFAGFPVGAFPEKTFGERMAHHLSTLRRLQLPGLLEL
jgi:hypothetical protein